MVTAEGVFPKIGNDPVYASEINNLFYTLGSPRYKNTGSYVKIILGNNTATIGSLVIYNVSGTIGAICCADYTGDGANSTYSPYMKLDNNFLGFPLGYNSSMNADNNTGIITFSKSMYLTSGTHTIYLNAGKSADNGSVVLSNIYLFTGGYNPIISGAF